MIVFGFNYLNKYLIKQSLHYKNGAPNMTRHYLKILN